MTDAVLQSPIFKYCRYAMAGFAFAVAAAAGLASWQLSAPLSAPTVFPFSETYYAQSAASRVPDVKIRRAQQALHVAPARAENWLLLASAYQSADGVLSPRVLRALRQSYAVAALSPDAHDWRLAYVYANWSLMPKDLQALAITETKVYVTRDSGLKNLQDLDARLTEPNGRFVLGVILMMRQGEQKLSWISGTNLNTQ